MNNQEDTVRLSDLRPGDIFTVRGNQYTVTAVGRRYVETEGELGAEVNYYGGDRIPRSFVRFKESQGLPNGTRTS